jgi:hypothetical protein
MNAQVIVESILMHLSLLTGLISGGIVYRYLSIEQRIIYVRCLVVVFFGVWATIRVYNGMYNIVVYTIGDFFFYGIDIIYVDYELKSFRKKKLFRILALLLLSGIPLNWIISGNLNLQSDVVIIMHLFLSIFIFYSILTRPTSNANQMLRWARLCFWLGDFFIVIYNNFLTWEMADEPAIQLNLIHRFVLINTDILMSISFLMAYFQKKKTLQLQE